MKDGVVYRRAGGHCIRCRTPLELGVPAIMVIEKVVHIDGGDWAIHQHERVAVCASCATPAEAAAAEHKRVCKGCGQHLLTPFVRYDWQTDASDPLQNQVCGARCEQRYRRRRRQEHREMVSCAACGVLFRPKRTDAKFCSNACRQSTHRRVVADVARRVDEDRAP
jgi:protein-arginine kinase activator protein McsA